MSQHNPYACLYHDWNGFGRCPHCRKEREEAKTIDEQMNDFFNELDRVARQQDSSYGK